MKTKATPLARYRQKLFGQVAIRSSLTRVI